MEPKSKVGRPDSAFLSYKEKLQASCSKPVIVLLY